MAMGRVAILACRGSRMDREANPDSLRREPQEQLETPAPNPFDAYGPQEIAQRVELAGVTKARLPVLPTLTLSVLAGAFIGFGAMVYLLVMTGNDMGFGPGRMLGGVAFSLGLILVIVAGAELFTGNNLVVMAWADRRITTRQLLRNWTLVYIGNFAGSLGLIALAWLAGLQDLGGGGLGATAEAVARAKVELSSFQALLRGILCNVLVCLAIWMCFAAHTVAGKILAIVFPIAAFVALGFEHCVANMFLIPFGMLVGGAGADWVGAWPFLANLLPVTLGNVIGGGVLVAVVYWLVYRPRSQGQS